MVCLILVQCYPSFDLPSKPLAESRTPVSRLDSRTHLIDIDGDLTPVPNRLRVLSSSTPPTTPAAFPTPRSPHTPAADPMDFDPLAQEPDEIIPDPGPPKIGAKKSKIFHRALNGECLISFSRQSIHNVL
jgi:hypothetical protein